MGEQNADLGYIHNTFSRTGNLWWDEYQGGDGAIFSSIDGSGDSYPIAECDNASRVIKYVVNLSYRYSGYSQADLRTQDINLVVDLYAHNPNAPEPPQGERPNPVESDGATIQNPDPDPVVDAIRDGVSSTTTSWWTGWWPVLHVRTAQVLATGSYSLEISLDILGAFALVGFDIWVPELDVLNDEGKIVAAQAENDEFLNDAMPQLKLSKYIAEGLLIAIEVLTCMALPADPVIYQALLALLRGWCAVMSVWLYAMAEAVRLGMMTPGAAFNEIFEMFCFTLAMGAADAVWGMRDFFKETWNAYKTSGSFRSVAMWGLAFNVLNVVAKIVFMGIMLGLMTYYLSIHFEPYTQNPLYT